MVKRLLVALVVCCKIEALNLVKMAAVIASLQACLTPLLAGDDCKEFVMSSCKIEFGNRLEDPVSPTSCPHVNCYPPTEDYPDGVCPLLNDPWYVREYSANSAEYFENRNIVVEGSGFHGKKGTVGKFVCMYRTYCGGCEVLEGVGVTVCMMVSEEVESLQTFEVDTPQEDCIPD
ncbi:MAG: hypothetical protein MUC83_00580 [Pirellula sp.]|jgi:hypothetical protein|nr:hypothetical protein [Pirellula sp.]